MSIDEARGELSSAFKNAGLNTGQSNAIVSAIEVYMNASIAFHVAHMVATTQDPPAETSDADAS